MTAVVPNGYLTILQAAEVLSSAMYAGVPDLPVVSQLRKEGTWAFNCSSARASGCTFRRDAKLLSVHALPPELGIAPTVFIRRKGPASPKVSALVEVLMEQSDLKSQPLRRRKSAA